MQYLLLIILFFSACTKKEEQQNSVEEHTTSISKLSESQISNIVAGLEQGDYTVLDPFFETNQLFPYLQIENGYIISLNTNTYELDDTNQVRFEKNNFMIAYTNRYNIVFLNIKNMVFTLDEIANTLVQQNIAFSQFQAIAKNILASDSKEYSNILTEIYPDTYTGVLYSNFYRLENILGIDLSAYQNSIFSYISQKTEPNLLYKQDSQIYWINYLAYIMFQNKKETGYIQWIFYDSF